MIEIEIKFKIPNPLTLFRNLKKNAYFEATKRNEDHYFIPKNENPSKYVKIIRLRSTFGSHGLASHILSCKQKKLVGSFEVNKETEIIVDNPQATRDFLDYLGFNPFVSKIKNTRLFHTNNPDIHLEFNHISKLGFFFEVEMLLPNKTHEAQARKQLETVVQRFGFNPKHAEKKTYLELLLSKDERFTNE